MDNQENFQLPDFRPNSNDHQSEDKPNHHQDVTDIDDDELLTPGHEPISRRDVLKVLAAGGSLAVLANLFKHFRKRGSSNPTEATPKVQIEVHQPTADPKREESADTIGDTYIDTLFKYAKRKDRLAAKQYVQKEYDHFSSQVGVSEALKRVKKYIPMINEVADDLLYTPDSYLRTFMPGLIYAESLGDPHEIGYDPLTENPITFGLCQLKPDAATDAFYALVNEYKVEEEAGNSENAKRLKRAISYVQSKFGNTSVRFTDANRHLLADPKTNIVIAMKYLDIIGSLYPERSLVLWTYHFGLGHMREALEVHTGRKLIIDNDVEDPETTASLVTKMRQSNDINYVVLRDSPKVNTKFNFKSKGMDSSTLYVPRIAAAVRLLDEV